MLRTRILRVYRERFLFIKNNNRIFRPSKEKEAPIPSIWGENFIPRKTSLTYEDAKKYFYDMTLIRKLEQEFSRLYKEKEIRGFCHLYSGQEAVCVGMEGAMEEGDTVITAYRAHGWTYTRGCDIRALIAELLGKSTGCSEGRGGSMHTYAKNFFGGNGIVGAQVPLGAGIALAHQYRNDGKVNFCLYGDGAANQGQVFEAYNIAALMKLPVVFVCENNLYGMGTSVSRASYSTKFYTRGDYIPGILVDGNCVLSVREATRAAAEYCRSGKGPLVMEALTYRYYGHSMSDPGSSYRSPGEVKTRRKNTDPIKTFQANLEASGLMSSVEMEEITEHIDKLLEEQIQLAANDPLPDVNSIAHYIYSQLVSPKEKVRGCSQHEWFHPN